MINVLNCIFFDSLLNFNNLFILIRDKQLFNPNSSYWLSKNGVVQFLSYVEEDFHKKLGGDSDFF